MQTYDAVFVGAGHNALVAAALLARQGWSVLLLDRADRPGGFVRTEELTLPGFLHDTWSSAHPLFVSGPAYGELRDDLTARGLEYVTAPYPTGVSLAGGRSAVLAAGEEGALEAERLAPGDGAVWQETFAGFWPHAGPVFELFGLDLTSARARDLIRELLVGPDGAPSAFAADAMRPACAVLDRFTAPELPALIAGWLEHLGRRPDEVGGALWVPLTLAALSGGMHVPRGGSGALASALARLVTDHGGEIRTGVEVTSIGVDGGRARSVRTDDGETYAATRAVVASTTPDRLYLELLAGADAVPDVVRTQAAGYRYGLGCVQVQLALAGPPHFPDERLDRCGQPILTPGVGGVRRALAQADAGLLPTEPTISLDVPSSVDAGRAPQGRAVARLQVLEVPTRVLGDAAGAIAVGGDGWSHDVKERFADRLLEIAEQHLPGLRGQVLARHVVSPAEIAAANPSTGPGDPYGGRHDLAQSYVFRPIPAAAGHATPVPGLYQLGAATWPGHGINGGSGWIVAQALLAPPP